MKQLEVGLLAFKDFWKLCIGYLVTLSSDRSASGATWNIGPESAQKWVKDNLKKPPSYLAKTEEKSSCLLAFNTFLDPM